MIFTFGNNKLDIDVQKTREYYAQTNYDGEGCTCDGCRNFAKAIEIFPKAVHDFFEELGLDIRKEAEIMVYCSENEGKSLLYGGFYHLCGELLSDNDMWIPLEGNTEISKGYAMNEEDMYVIADGYRVGFSKKCALLSKDFPRPVVQMEIEFLVPWVLETENTY